MFTKIKAIIKSLLATLASTIGISKKTQHAQMQRFYDKHFPEMGVNVPHFADVGGKVGLYIAQGLTCDLVYATWRKAFPCWKWCNGSIDAQLDPAREARSAANGSYLVYVRNGAEPDAQFLGKSVGKADPHGTLGTTLLERMVHGKIHFDRTGKHLDVIGVTLCSGSRYCGGNVPGVRLGSGHEVGVGGYGVDSSSGRYGVREAVLDSLES